MMRSFRRALDRFREVQSRVLLRKLRRNAESDFGRKCRFRSIRSVSDFRRAVPVMTYADYEPWVERARQGQWSAMFGPGQRVHMFAMTSGTTSRPKYVPVPDPFLAEYRRGWMTWGIHAFLDHPEAFQGRILQLVSAMDDELAPCGLPCGAMSGLTAHVQRRAARNIYVLPPCVSHIKDTPSKYYVALLLALRRPTLVILSANPSTLLGLARTLDDRKDDLLRDLADGTLRDDLAVPDDVRDSLRDRLKPEPVRAAELSRAAERLGALAPKDVWRMPLLGCWKGGTLSLYLRDFPRWFGDAPVRDIGLIASEGRMTIPLGDAGSAGVLDAESSFFEFLPAEGGQRAGGDTLLPHELEVGREYFLILTCSAGLYRYDIGDLVRVEGFKAGSPLVSFLNKGAHYSSLTGEKLSEHQVVEAVGAALDRAGAALTSYCLSPAWAAGAPYYVLIAEESDVGDPAAAHTLAVEVDALLRSANVEYNTKRASGRLGPLRVRTVRDGTWREYDLVTIAERRRGVEQYKHKFLVGDVDFERRFPAIGEFGPEV
jgi:hypothetical protein